MSARNLQNHTLGSTAVLFKEGVHNAIMENVFWRHVVYVSFLHKHKFTNSLQIDYDCWDELQKETNILLSEIKVTKLFPQGFSIQGK
jgi:hypothetical protein